MSDFDHALVGLSSLFADLLDRDLRPSDLLPVYYWVSTAVYDGVLDLWYQQGDEDEGGTFWTTYEPCFEPDRIGFAVEVLELLRDEERYYRDYPEESTVRLTLTDRAKEALNVA